MSVKWNEPHEKLLGKKFSLLKFYFDDSSSQKQSLIGQEIITLLISS